MQLVCIKSLKYCCGFSHKSITVGMRGKNPLKMCIFQIPYIRYVFFDTQISINKNPKWCIGSFNKCKHANLAQNISIDTLTPRKLRASLQLTKKLHFIDNLTFLFFLCFSLFVLSSQELIRFGLSDPNNIFFNNKYVTCFLWQFETILTKKNGFFLCELLVTPELRLFYIIVIKL